MRELHGLGELARVLEEAAVVHQRAIVALAGASTEVLYHNAHELYGSHKLRDLEQSTQDDRVKRGYSANDPLKRTGELLQDRLEKAHVHDMGGIGSAEPAAAAHEKGYFTRPFGNPHAQKVFVAPRPVFEMAMVESVPEVEALTNEAIGITFGQVGSVTLKP